MKLLRIALLGPLFAAVAWLMTGCGVAVHGVSLTWNETNNADPAASFAVYRDNAQIATTAHLAWLDNPVAPGVHRYYVVALDARGNASAPSAPFTISVP